MLLQPKLCSSELKKEDKEGGQLDLHKKLTD